AGRREDEVEHEHTGEAEAAAELLDPVELVEQGGDEKEERPGVGKDQDAVLADEGLERRTQRGSRRPGRRDRPDLGDRRGRRHGARGRYPRWCRLLRG